MNDATQPAGGPSQSAADASPEATTLDSPEAIRAGLPGLTGEDTFPIPIPPPQRVDAGREEDAAALGRPVFRLEAVLVVLLLILAFFLGSFVANHSSVWSHLACGRLLARGDYHFGVDPFCSTTAGVYWTNPSWFYDLCNYLVYTNLGGAALIVSKALLVVLLAVVLLRVRRPGASWWPSIVCIGLALVAMSPRLNLESFVCSLLFLGVTLSLLFRGPLQQEADGPAAEDRPQRLSRLWLLPPLFALWANVDGWFLVGPLTVALVLIGELLQKLGQAGDAVEVPARAQRLRTLAVVLPVSLVACLLNPHFHHVFVLPAEVADLVVRTGGWLPGGMLASATNLREIGRHDPQILQVLAYYWHSPFSVDYWSSSSRGLNAAGLAYYPLLVLGLVSFALTAGGEGGYRWARLLVWAGFAGLSAALVRAVPLFAVVAGPITALNLQDFARQWSGGTASVGAFQRTWALGGRGVTVLGFVALLVLAWLGWLHPLPLEPRLSHHVAWEVRADPQLRKAAEQLDHWQAQAKLGGTFNFSPDFGNYCTWFAPHVKPFFDYRFDLFGGVAGDIGRLRQALREFSESRQQGRGGSGLADTVRNLLRKHGLDHLVLTGLDAVSSRLTIRLLPEWKEWPLLYGDGRAEIFGWSDARTPARARTFQALAQSPTAMAFGKRPAEAALPAEPRPFLEERQPWRELLLGPPAPAGAVEEARYWSVYFDLLGQPYAQLLHEPFYSLRQIPGQAVGVTLGLAGAGAAAAPSALFGTGGAEMGERADNLGPPAALILAVQAARRATAANPTDPAAYRMLALSYRNLLQKQEQYWTRRAGENPKALRQMVRRLQWIAAEKELLRLQPDNLEAHVELAQVYLDDFYYLDVALEHLAAAQVILEKREPQPGQAQALKRQREQLARSVKNLAREVELRRNYYDMQALGQKVPMKIKIALHMPFPTTNAKKQETFDRRGLGLGRQALKVLQDATIARLADDEYLFTASWEMQLLLEMGEVRELAQTMEGAKLESGPLNVAYLQTKVFLAAVLGDYALLDQTLARMEPPTEKAQKRQGALALVLATDVAFDPRVPLQAVAKIANHLHLQTSGALGLLKMAEVRFLRGLMNLENGDTAAALDHFRQTRQLIGTWANFPDRPILDGYLALLEANQQRP